MTGPLARRSDTKRTIVATIRETNPHGSIYTLWVEYNAEHKERPIGWQYWMRVCREVDRVRTASETQLPEKDDAR